MSDLGKNVGLCSAGNAVGITVNTEVQRARAVYVGIAGSYDFSFDGGTTWVTFAGVLAGSILDIQANAARNTSGGTAPASTAIVFLY